MKTFLLIRKTNYYETFYMKTKLEEFSNYFYEYEVPLDVLYSYPLQVGFLMTTVSIRGYYS